MVLIQNRSICYQVRHANSSVYIKYNTSVHSYTANIRHEAQLSPSKLTAPEKRYYKLIQKVKVSIDRTFSKILHSYTKTTKDYNKDCTPVGIALFETATTVATRL